MANPFDVLVGRTVVSVSVGAENQSFLRVKTDDGETRDFRVLGDCCSESWFSDVVGLDAILGARVLSVDELPLKKASKDGRSRQEFDLVYGYDFKTLKGVATVTFRNSSNGYYGGWLSDSYDHVPANAANELIGSEWSA